jgi:hypothetical protein
MCARPSLRATPATVALVVAALYVLWAGWYVHYHSVTSLAHVGAQFQGRPDGSTAIGALRRDARDQIGYDGQFYLYTALDPVRAHHYLDEPAYRLSRPLYPLGARLLGGGSRRAIPWALLVLSVAGAVSGTLALGLILAARGVSPWYGALFGLYPGVFLAVTHDLAEALAYGLMALGLVAFGRDGKRVLVAATLFGIAGATRETTLLFPFAFAVWLAFRARRTKDAALVVGIALAPYLAVKIALRVWLDSWGSARATRIEAIPFHGLTSQWPWADPQVQQILSVVIPAFAAVALVWFAKREVTPAFCALVLNVLVLVVLLPAPSYVGYLASGRIAIGVVVAFLLCLPDVLERGRVAQGWVLLTLWLLPLYSVLPVALRR